MGLVYNTKFGLAKQTRAMSNQEKIDDFYAAGRKLAEHIADSKGKEVSTATLQALIRDFLHQHEDLQEALRSIVTRPDLLQLAKLASSGKGGAQKTAFVENLRKIYSAETIVAVDSLACGLLGLSCKASLYESGTRTHLGAGALACVNEFSGRRHTQIDAYQEAQEAHSEGVNSTKEYSSARIRYPAFIIIALTALVSGAYLISIRNKGLSTSLESYKHDMTQNQIIKQGNAENQETPASVEIAKKERDIHSPRQAQSAEASQPQLKWAQDWSYTSNTHLTCAFRHKGDSEWYNLGVPRAIDGWLENKDGSSQKIIKVFLNHEIYYVIYNGYDHKGKAWSWDIGQNGYELRTESVPEIIGCIRKDILANGSYFGYPNTRGTRSDQ